MGWVGGRRLLKGERGWGKGGIGGIGGDHWRSRFISGNIHVAVLLIRGTKRGRMVASVYTKFTYSCTIEFIGK